MPLFLLTQNWTSFSTQVILLGIALHDGNTHGKSNNKESEGLYKLSPSQSPFSPAALNTTPLTPQSCDAMAPRPSQQPVLDARKRICNVEQIPISSVHVPGSKSILSASLDLRINSCRRLEEVTSQLNAIQASLAMNPPSTAFREQPNLASAPTQLVTAQNVLAADGMHDIEAASPGFYRFEDLPEHPCLGHTSLEQPQIINLFDQ